MSRQKAGKRCSCGSLNCASNQCLVEEKQAIIEEEEEIEDEVELLPEPKEPEKSESLISEKSESKTHYERVRSLTPVVPPIPSIHSPPKEPSLVRESSPLFTPPKSLSIEPIKELSDNIIEEEPEQDESACTCTFKDEKNELIQRYIAHFQQNIKHVTNVQRLRKKFKTLSKHRNVATMFDSTCDEDKCRYKPVIHARRKYCPSNGLCPYKTRDDNKQANKKRDDSTSMAGYMTNNGSQDGSIKSQRPASRYSALRLSKNNGPVSIHRMHSKGIQKSITSIDPTSSPQGENESFNTGKRNPIMNEKGQCKCCRFCRTQLLEKPACPCGTFNNDIIPEEQSDEQISPQFQASPKNPSVLTDNKLENQDIYLRQNSSTLESSQIPAKNTRCRDSPFGSMGFNDQYFSPIGCSDSNVPNYVPDINGYYPYQPGYNVKPRLGPSTGTANSYLSSHTYGTVNPQQCSIIDFDPHQAAQPYNVTNSGNYVGTPLTSQTINPTLNISNYDQFNQLQGTTHGSMASPNRISSNTTRGTAASNNGSHNDNQPRGPNQVYNGPPPGAMTSPNRISSNTTRGTVVSNNGRHNYNQPQGPNQVYNGVPPGSITYSNRMSSNTTRGTAASINGSNNYNQARGPNQGYNGPPPGSMASPNKISSNTTRDTAALNNGSYNYNQPNQGSNSEYKDNSKSPNRSSNVSHGTSTMTDYTGNNIPASSTHGTLYEIMPSPQVGNSQSHNMNSPFPTVNNYVDPSSPSHRTDNGSNRTVTETMPSAREGSNAEQRMYSGISTVNDYINTAVASQRIYTGNNSPVNEIIQSPRQESIASGGTNAGFNTVSNYMNPSPSPQRADPNNGTGQYMQSPRQGSTTPQSYNYVDPSASAWGTGAESNATAIEAIASPQQGSIISHGTNIGFNTGNNFADPSTSPRRTGAGSNASGIEAMASFQQSSIISHGTNNGFNTGNNFANPSTSLRRTGAGSNGSAIEAMASPLQGSIISHGTNNGFNAVHSYVDPSISPRRTGAASSATVNEFVPPAPDGSNIAHAMNTGFNAVNNYVDRSASPQRTVSGSNGIVNEFVPSAPQGSNISHALNNNYVDTSVSPRRTLAESNATATEFVPSAPQGSKISHPMNTGFNAINNYINPSVSPQRTIIGSNATANEFVPSAPQGSNISHAINTGFNTVNNYVDPSVAGGIVTANELLPSQQEPTTQHDMNSNYNSINTYRDPSMASRRTGAGSNATAAEYMQAPRQETITTNSTNIDIKYTPQQGSSIPQSMNSAFHSNNTYVDPSLSSRRTGATSNTTGTEHMSSGPHDNSGFHSLESSPRTIGTTSPSQGNASPDGFNSLKDYTDNTDTAQDSNLANQNVNSITKKQLVVVKNCSCRKPPKTIRLCFSGHCRKTSNIILKVCKPPTGSTQCGANMVRYCHDNVKYTRPKIIPRAKTRACPFRSILNEKVNPNIVETKICPTRGTICKKENCNYFEKKPSPISDLLYDKLDNKSSEAITVGTITTPEVVTQIGIDEFENNNGHCCQCENIHTCTATASCDDVDKETQYYLTAMNVECKPCCFRPLTCNAACKNTCNPVNQVPPCKLCNGPKYCINIHHPFQSFYPNMAVQVSSLDLLQKETAKVEKIQVERVKSEKLDIILQNEPTKLPTNTNIRNDPPIGDVQVTSKLNTNYNSTPSSNNSSETKPIETAVHRPTPPKGGKRFGGSNYRLMRNAVVSELSTERFRPFPRSNEIGDRQSDYNFSDLSGEGFKNQGFSGDSQNSRRVSLKYDFPLFDKNDNPSMMGSTTSVEERIRNLRQNMEKIPDGSESGGSNRSENTIQGRTAMVIDEDDEDAKPIFRRSALGVNQAAGRKVSKR